MSYVYAGEVTTVPPIHDPSRLFPSFRRSTDTLICRKPDQLPRRRTPRSGLRRLVATAVIPRLSTTRVWDSGSGVRLRIMASSLRLVALPQP
jgi:hypothetical protein